MKTRIALVSAVLLLALTGCAGTAAQPTSDAQDAAPTVETTPTETPEPVLTAAPAPSGADATFLVEVRKRTDVTTIAQATDEQLLAAGHQACDALGVNPDIEALRLIEGEQPRENGRYFDSVVIGTHAAMFLCPEFDPS